MERVRNRTDVFKIGNNTFFTGIAFIIADCVFVQSYQLAKCALC